MFASKEVVEARKSICGTCEKNFLLMCTKCGCVIATKVLGRNTKCPLKKW
jgi:hypothetical protein